MIRSWIVLTVIMGTPNYFDNVSSILKTFIDRLQPHYKTRELRDKETILFMVTGKRTEETRKSFSANVEGFVKHMVLRVIGMAILEGLCRCDLEQSPKSRDEVNELVENMHCRKFEE